MFLWFGSFGVLAAEKPAATAPAPANLRLPVAASAVPGGALLDPDAGAWQQVPVQRLALNRTPPLYDTDPPVTADIALVEVRTARAEGKLLVHMSWRDTSGDVAEVAPAPATPPETRNLKEPTAATERFFDAAAVMFPAGEPAGMFTPSLQMGEPGQPVRIYYWNAARGALLMEAQGRGTTQRTGATFPARGSYRAGVWRVVLELPNLAPGVPLAFAVWDGSQLDRDGRKYFTVWHWLE
jgi:complex iron-sulfur molybdoenzyme family reductase subunit gamma